MSKPHIRIVTARIERDGRYLITQRNPHAVLPLLWEFPGGRVEDGESDQDALRRELRDKVGIDAKVGELSLSVTHEYERYHLDMCVYHTTTADTPSAGNNPQNNGRETVRRDRHSDVERLTT